MNARPSLGDRVVFRATLERIEEGNRREWRSRNCAPTPGVYIGYRTVYDGTYFGGYWDSHDSFGPGGEPGYLKITRSISHALVVVGVRKAPLRVPFDALEGKP